MGVLQRETFFCVFWSITGLQIQLMSSRGRTTWLYLSILVINKNVPGAVVLQVGELQAVGGADLGWLERCVQRTDLHDGFWLSGLQTVKKSTAKGRIVLKCVRNENCRRRGSRRVC